MYQVRIPYFESHLKYSVVRVLSRGKNFWKVVILKKGLEQVTDVSVKNIITL